MTDTAAVPDRGARKIGFVALTALVMGSMLGAGILSLPQNMAATSGSAAVLIAWGITLFGMLMLALVFQNLSNRKPEVEGGVYGYARAGFGDFMGFNSAWGYWMSGWVGNVSLFVVMFSALAGFKPFAFFADGNNWQSILASSVLLWLLTWTVMRGVHEAAFVNILTTIARVLPLILFVIVVILAFNVKTFSTDFWGNVKLGTVLDQVKGAMLVTVWVYIGIEGATVYSTRALNKSDIGRSTIVGFLLTSVLLVAVSVLSLGIMSQPELAGLKNPSAAGVLQHVVGPWGADLINACLVIAVGGELLAWTMLPAEIPYLGARDGVFPKMFGQVNRHQSPVNALWLTNGLIQVMLLVTLYSSAGYLALLSLATSMVLIPYLLCGGYAWLVALRGEGYPAGTMARNRDMLIGVLATGYCVWLIYAAGLKYLFLSMILYTPGIAFYWWAKWERGEKPFKGFELVLALFMAVLGVIACVMVAQGKISLN
ncbi:MAG: arginine-ornithine antiporter [Paludibacterium sp.]|uniref:arginine-ornithine antiporter n=1 Tax=Paludibacterium sp. TaxID=1917523 RepID=UPI0025F72EAE|nr:arginine-ornithine antiporter [Paludibacterium sp.]MBV8048500.1 arginine-ornithine antiporter [Paludibacterium sp.]MBV8647360.1 arginine-ornithine antiporter [Paludibacterium sp.]